MHLSSTCFPAETRLGCRLSLQACPAVCPCRGLRAPQMCVPCALCLCPGAMGTRGSQILHKRFSHCGPQFPPMDQRMSDPLWPRLPHTAVLGLPQSICEIKRVLFLSSIEVKGIRFPEIQTQLNHLLNWLSPREVSRPLWASGFLTCEMGLNRELSTSPLQPLLWLKHWVQVQICSCSLPGSAAATPALAVEFLMPRTPPQLRKPELEI